MLPIQSFRQQGTNLCQRHGSQFTVEWNLKSHDVVHLKLNLEMSLALLELAKLI